MKMGKVRLDSRDVSALTALEQKKGFEVPVSRVNEILSRTTPGLTRSLDGNLDSRVRGRLTQTLDEWNLDGENLVNGLEPESSREDREEYLETFKAFVLGDFSQGLKLKESHTSEFDKVLNEIDTRNHFDPSNFDIGGLTVEDAVNRAGHFYADRYSHESGMNRTRNLILTNGDAQLVDSAGAINDQENMIETTKLVQKPIDSYEAALKLILGRELTSEELEMFRINYPILEGENGYRWGREKILTQEDAEEILGFDELSRIEELLEPSEEALHRLWKSTAEKIEDEYGIYHSRMQDPLTYFEMLAYSEAIDDGWKEELWETANRELEQRENSIGRDEDDEGRRIYVWNGNKAYSVTTINKPPRIDFGSRLQEWLEENDGTGDSFDSDIISDYATARGTLAHEAVLSNYVEDPESVKDGNEEQLRQKISDIDKGDGLEDLRRWKREGKMAFYEDQSRNTGFVDNAWHIAENELEWVEKAFRQLEDELGLCKENVIASEKMFGVETSHQDLSLIDSFKYAGQIDLLYQHKETGETVLLDLKTSKGLYDKYKIQSAAYAEAIERSDWFDIDTVDRVVVPLINPETMMDESREPEIYSSQPHEDYQWREFLDCSGIEEVNGAEYPREQWSPGSYRQEAFNLFARAASQMPEIH